MPAEIPVRNWREVWLKWLDRLPLSDHPLEPEISAEVFVHRAAGPQPQVKAPSPAPAGGQPVSH